jgi:hypothetical protein
MSTPVFNIIQDEKTSIQWQHCRLVIELNPNYLYYAVLNEDNTVVALKFYQLNYNNNQEKVNLLEETVNEDPVLQQKMMSVRIIFNWPENCIVPRVYFDKDHSREMLGLMFGYLYKGLLLSEKLSEADMFIIYRIPPVLDDFFQRRFTGCTYRHYYSLWLDTRNKNVKSPATQVNIIFNPNEIIAAVFINGQLQVMQNHPYQTPEDIAWHMLNVYHRFNLKQEETPLLVGGMIDQNSAMYAELLKYFINIEFDSMPEGINLPEQFQSFPPHFFSPILKLALCAS